ncbi:MAG TPA: hypothetical protein VFE08_02045, partial [Candidatus Sulfotelmatobacter sp.]|nr:hypothetical protein [Candidatus Sulfotelmatobacter sp.]
MHQQVLLRQGLRRLLDDEPDLEVVSEADNAAECLRKVHELRPDVVIADSTTFGLSPAETEIHLIRESPCTKLVLLNPQEHTSAEELIEEVRKTYISGRVMDVEPQAQQPVL